MAAVYEDFFTLTELARSIKKYPFVPGMLKQLGLFQFLPIPGTSFGIEERKENNAGVLIKSERGTASNAATLPRNKVHTFNTEHYRVNGAVTADEVLNARGAGISGAREILTNRRDRLILSMRNDIDITLENLRMACLNAPTNAFGNAPASVAVAFGASDSAIRSAIFNNIIKPMETALKGQPYTGLLALCDDTFWAGFIESKTVQATYLNWTAAAQLRGDVLESFPFGGVTWVRYRGTGTTVIESGKAKVVPLGVPDLFIEAFAPADTLDQIGAGALGVPYYAQAYPIDEGNRGWALEMQTNPKMVCTNPQAVLTIGLS